MRSCDCVDPAVFGHRCTGYHPEGDQGGWKNDVPGEGFRLGERETQAYATAERALREYREALNNRFTMPGRPPRRRRRVSF